ncbi:hypothetical protein BRD22_09450 [Halobacteriales archaeon SW_8_68_21]|nr:MAG: hypothetical protein BRD22_09450 [Halobacteriales archaeon SW_8_68_21]
MSNKGSIPDRIETEQYTELLHTAQENLYNQYPDTESTREFHSKRFRYWLSWCDDQDAVYPCKPTTDDVKRYTRWLNGDGASNRKIEHRLRAIRITYEILREEGVVDNNPASDYYADEFFDGKSSNVRTGASNKAGPRADFETISPAEFEKMLENVDAPRFRNQLILKLAWQLMLRVEQITTIRLSDIEDNKNMIYLADNKKDEEDDEDYWYEGFYKGDVQYMLDRWRDKERGNLAPTMSEQSDYLIVSHQSEQMKPESITGIVRDAAKNAGVQEEMYVDGKGDTRYKVTSHTLRRSAASYVANKTDYPIQMLSNDLNHRSVDTTVERYVDDDPEERRSRRQSIDEL